MKYVRNCLLVVALVLGCSLVLVDHYRIGMSLAQIEEDAAYNNEQLALTFMAQDQLQFAAVSQEVVSLQARRVSKLECLLDKYAEMLTELKKQNETLEATVTTSAEQIRDLIDSNARLDAELDAKTAELKRLQEELLRAQKEVEENQTHG